MKNTNKTTMRTMPDWSKDLAKEIIRYLAELMADTMAMRIVALVLICAEVPVWVISDLSGFCTKTVYKLQKLAREGRFSELFSISGGGRPSKLADIKDNLFDILDGGSCLITGSCVNTAGRLSDRAGNERQDILAISSAEWLCHYLFCTKDHAAKAIVLYMIADIPLVRGAD